jgi:hypothetical protein
MHELEIQALLRIASLVGNGLRFRSQDYRNLSLCLVDVTKPSLAKDLVTLQSAASRVVKQLNVLPIGPKWLVGGNLGLKDQKNRVVPGRSTTGKGSNNKKIK